MQLRRARPTIRLLRDDLSSDWESPHPKRCLQTDDLTPLHPLSELPHPILAKAVSSFRDDPADDNYVGPIASSTNLPLLEIKAGQSIQVTANGQRGTIKLEGKLVFISQALIGEPVGLLEHDDGWTVRYGPIELGNIVRGGRLQRPSCKRCGLEDNATRCPQGPQQATAADANEPDGMTRPKPGETTADKSGRLLFLYDPVVAIREVTRASHFGRVCEGRISVCSRAGTVPKCLRKASTLS